jgi:hypothetical protein
MYKMQCYANESTSPKKQGRERSFSGRLPSGDEAHPCMQRSNEDHCIPQYWWRPAGGAAVGGYASCLRCHCACALVRQPDAAAALRGHPATGQWTVTGYRTPCGQLWAMTDGRSCRENNFFKCKILLKLLLTIQ